MGRPGGPDRGAQPPGLRADVEFAVAEILESDRLGFRNPVATAMIAQILPKRPELRLLIMDQLFPEDPFQPDPRADNDDPAAAARRLKQ